ncbi:MarR family transcriptional regulator [Marinobacter salsuginis]|uniref:MarR family winged helix-turn-helix transcriptional regulator n=1 Tax=Marinobacter salsuginis TaxID=418719 RepID=UPI001C97EE95|nr:MarR family transcriptional regulator [Marinobacter salsuginis]MBY6071165.1 MarR family transcriptional regulator [Marinobacter salsuginis]
MSEHQDSEQPVPGTDLLTLDRQMCFALYSASLAMTKLYKPLLSELGLTYPQYLVMLVLWEKDGIRVSDLKERLFLDYGTLTPLVKRLEKHGLLVRQRSPEDERQVIVRLTEKGRSLHQAAIGVPQRVARASGCSLTELEDLKTELCALRNRIQNQLDNHFAESA